MGFFPRANARHRRVMASEGKTSFPLGAPSSFPVSPRDSRGLRKDAGRSLVSPDRAAGLGWQRPPPLGEWTGAGCSVRDVREQPHIRCAPLDDRDRGANARRAHSSSGHQQAAFGREYAGMTGRPPGALLSARTLAVCAHAQCVRAQPASSGPGPGSAPRSQSVRAWTVCAQTHAVGAHTRATCANGGCVEAVCGL